MMTKRHHGGNAYARDVGTRYAMHGHADDFEYLYGYT